MTILLGPADADHYRVKVGRYGERWYADPLPACDIADATEAVWPAISTVKGASGRDWSFVALKRVAHAETSELERLPALPEAQRYDACKSLNDYGLSVAAGRGTIVHWWGEDLLHGREPRGVSEVDLMAHRLPPAALAEAKRYLPALRAFFDAYQPELIATEYVVINRTLNGKGYGATPDGLWIIGGDPYAYDFKTRTADGDHAAYPEDGAQIAAGVSADYMIVEGPNGAERRRLPEVKAGMVVSIKPEGCRVYPVDIAEGFAHFSAMHAWWCARLDERAAIGRPWAARNHSKIVAPAAPDAVEHDTAGVLPDTPAVDRSDLVERVRWLVDQGHAERLSRRWPEGVPGFKGDVVHTADQLAAVAEVVRRLEDECSAPFRAADTPVTPAEPEPEPPPRSDPEPDPEPFTTPDPTLADEGDFVEDDVYELLRKRFDMLDVDAKAILGRITSEALHAGMPISMRDMKSVRRWSIARALVAWCEVGWDDDIIRDQLGALMDSDIPRHPATPLGAAFGALTIDEADRLADIAQTVADGAALEHQDDRWVVVPF